MDPFSCIYFYLFWVSFLLFLFYYETLGDWTVIL